MKKVLLTGSDINGKGIVAHSDIKAGDIALSTKGIILKGDSCSLFALQIDSNNYIELNGKEAMYVNHSCNPNCYVDFELIDKGQLNFRALRDIETGEEITFNYNSTEYDMQHWNCHFECNCGSTECIEEVKGFKFLGPINKDRLKLFLSPYLESVYINEKRVNTN